MLPIKIEYLLRRLLHMMEPEAAHDLSLDLLQLWALLPTYIRDMMITSAPIADTILAQHIATMDFAHPLGIAAGYDKNALVYHALMMMGVSHVEVGTITPKAQIGNPQPRIFRLPKDQALINRLGFNNAGMIQIACNIRKKYHHKTGILGVNIGCNKETIDKIDDYYQTAAYCGDLGDYITINVSSPNTPNLRDLQHQKYLQQIISKIRDIHPVKPIFVKLAPDMQDNMFDNLVDHICHMDINAVIISNTTISRQNLQSHDKLTKQQGGLSGKPLFMQSTKLVKRAYRLINGKIPIIAIGGVSNAQDVYEKIKAGASLVQVYTGFVYHGSTIIRDTIHQLPTLLHQDGFTHISQAIGKSSDA